MKILVLGATGRTGKYIIEEALKKGHKIFAIARDVDGISAAIRRAIQNFKCVIFNKKTLWTDVKQ